MPFPKPYFYNTLFLHIFSFFHIPPRMPEKLEKPAWGGGQTFFSTKTCAKIYTRSILFFSIIFIFSSFFLSSSIKQGRPASALVKGDEKKSHFFLENCLFFSPFRSCRPQNKKGGTRPPEKESKRKAKRKRDAPYRQESRQASPPCLRLCPWVMKCTCSATLTARRQMRDRLCTTRI